MTFGAKLQRLRKARGWTQEQLAEKAGVSRQSLSGWENDAALPDTAHVIALADLFGVTTDYLLRRDAQEQAAPSAAAASASKPWRMSPRELGARLMIGSAGAGLAVLRTLASLYPARVGIDGRTYTGFAGFLQYNDLWWALWLMIAVLAAGLLQAFGPWLVRKGRQLLRWMRQD